MPIETGRQGDPTVGGASERQKQLILALSPSSSSLLSSTRGNIEDKEKEADKQLNYLASLYESRQVGAGWLVGGAVSHSPQ